LESLGQGLNVEGIDPSSLGDQRILHGLLLAVDVCIMRSFG
jgi:hypothetical protein